MLNSNDTEFRKHLIANIQHVLNQRRTTDKHSMVHTVDFFTKKLEENPMIKDAFIVFHRAIEHLCQLKKQAYASVLENRHSKIREKNQLDRAETQVNRSAGSKFDLESSNHGLLTKSIRKAIEKPVRQRTTRDIEILENFLRRCQGLSHFPRAVRYYAARSVVLLNFPGDTVLTRENEAAFLVYIVIDGQCRLLIESDQTTLVGRSLNLGETYGDDLLRFSVKTRLFGLKVDDKRAASLIGFFPREIRAHEIYFSDFLKRSFLNKLQSEKLFSMMLWRDDISQYFLKWSTYKQYEKDDIVYGNELTEHDRLYFIVHGEVSFVRLAQFETSSLKNPNSIRRFVIEKPKKIKFKEFLSPLVDETPLNSAKTPESPCQLTPNSMRWRFLHVFRLSKGNFFGFESSSERGWYLARNIVDLISIPKNRFQSFGHFAPMIFDKMRDDFIEMFPDENSTRNFYLNKFYVDQSIFDSIGFDDENKRFNVDRYGTDWIPKEENLLLKNISSI